MIHWKKLLSLLLTAALLLVLCPAALAAGEAGGGSWTIGMYMCGSNLEDEDSATCMDLAEIMMSKLPDNVKVLILLGGSKQWFKLHEELAESIPEYAGAYEAVQEDFVDVMAEADPKFEEDHLFLLTAEGGVKNVQYIGKLSDGVEPLPKGYPSMSEPDTLSMFLGALLSGDYKADHYMLSFWDHGGGSFGGSEIDSRYIVKGQPSPRLYMKHICDALASHVGPGKAVDKLDIIGFDCCLMNTLEIAELLSPYADYLTASEEIEPSTGWNYAWLGAIGTDYDGRNGVTTEDVGKAMIDYYGLSLLDIMTFELSEAEAAAMEAGAIQNEYGYRDWIGENLPDWPRRSWDAVPEQTMALVDLSRMDAVMTEFNALCAKLESLIRSAEAGNMASKKTYSQLAQAAELTTHMLDPAFLDIASLNERVQDYVEDPEIKALFEKLSGAVWAGGSDSLASAGGSAVIYRGVGAAFTGCAGMTMVFPVQGLYNNNISVDMAKVFYDREFSAQPSRSFYDYALGLKGSKLRFEGEVPEAVFDDEGYQITVEAPNAYNIRTVSWGNLLFDEELNEWFLGSVTVAPQSVEGSESVTYHSPDLESVARIGVKGGELQNVSSECTITSSAKKYEIPIQFANPAAKTEEEKWCDCMLHVVFSKDGEDWSEPVFRLAPVSEEGVSSKTYDPFAPATGLLDEAGNFTFRLVREYVRLLEHTDGEEDEELTPSGVVYSDPLIVTKDTLVFDTMSGKMETSFVDFLAGRFEIVDLAGNSTLSEPLYFSLLPDYFTEAEAVAAGEPGNSVESKIPRIPDQAYTGGPISPRPSLGPWEKAIVEFPEKLFELKYSDNVRVGTAAVRVRAREDGEFARYAGSEFTMTFQIVAGDDVNAGFTDVPPAHWACDGVAYVCANGLMSGVSAGRFDPSGRLACGTLAAALTGLGGEDAVEEAYLNISPAAPVSREEAAKALWICAGKPEAKKLPEQYPDWDDVDASAQQAVAWCVEQGIILGMEDGVLDPSGYATRAQAAVMLKRYGELTP